MLRFQEARGVHYEDPTSDSSWAPREVKDLDVNMGSHVQPGRLKNAVFGGFIKDLDNYFQASVVKTEEEILLLQVAEAEGHISSIKQEIDGLNARMAAVSDKEAKAIIGDQVSEMNKKLAGLKKAIAEKKGVLGEIAKAKAEAVSATEVATHNAKMAELFHKLAVEAGNEHAAEDAAGIRDAKVKYTVCPTCGTGWTGEVPVENCPHCAEVKQAEEKAAAEALAAADAQAAADLAAAQAADAAAAAAAEAAGGSGGSEGAE